MKFINWKKTSIACTILLSAVLFSAPLKADKSFEDYYKEFPWIGLATDEIHYGPVTVTKVNINHSKKIATVASGEIIHGKLHYKIDKDQASQEPQHLIVGIEGIGGQDCVMHSVNLFDSKGKANFTLTAPDDPGVYQVRIMYNKGITCSQAISDWKLGHEPSASATIGIIVVK